jgi:hypothetical protein
MQLSHLTNTRFVTKASPMPIKRFVNFNFESVSLSLLLDIFLFLKNKNNKNKKLNLLRLIVTKEERLISEFMQSKTTV